MDGADGGPSMSESKRSRDDKTIYAPQHESTGYVRLIAHTQTH